MEPTMSLLILLAALVVAAPIPSGMSFPSASTVPAFLWFSHSHHNRLEVAVNYQTISPKELVKSVLSEWGWSNILCSGEDLKQPLDLALIFVGRELRSSDMYAYSDADQSLVDLLKVSFTRSNFSMAFPYVAASEEGSMVKNLLAGFKESCGQGVRFSNVALLGSCSLEGGKFQKFAYLQSVHDYLASRMKKESGGKADVIVYCHEGSHYSKESGQPQSEGETFADLASSLDKSGAKYTVLYVSDPLVSNESPYRDLERFLAEGDSGKGLGNSTICDEVCQIKSSLLEGLLVGIVLLIILISGICCMMGIDTPTRFETPQES